MSTETKEKKGFKPFVFIIVLELLIFIGGMVTALVFIFTGFGDTERLMTGVYMIYGVAGFVPVILMPTVFIMVFRRRKVMFSSLSSFKLSKIGPYAPGYISSGTKNPRFCEYCGFEVIYGERECPECGGPVKTINSSYI